LNSLSIPVSDEKAADDIRRRGKERKSQPNARISGGPIAAGDKDRADDPRSPTSRW